VRGAQGEAASGGAGASASEGGGEGKSNAASSGEESEGVKLEEVVVTAQKRKERLQDVPISVAVLSGKELEAANVVSVTDALGTVPGLSLAQDGQSGGSTVTIRGVAPGGPLFFGGPTTGYYLDSLPFGFVTQGFAPDSNAYDLERVEVLRGPQGTLYGASALNGVVRVLTANPDLNDFELKARAAASTTEGGDPGYRGDMAVNVPILPGVLAGRLILGTEERGGWIDRPNLRDNNANDGEINNYRLKLRAQPTPDLTIDLSAWLSREDYDENNLGTEERISPSPYHEPVSVDYDLYGLTVGYDFNAFSLTSSTSYLTLENTSLNDISWFSGLLGLTCDRSQPVNAPGQTCFLIETFTESTVFAQEIALHSTHEGPWRWTLGAIYRDESEKLAQGFNAPASFLPGGNTSESFAVFGELTRSFLDGQLELTGGLRYFEDEQTDDSALPAVDASFDALSPRLVLTWHPNERTMVYGSYSEGFRSGNPGNINTRFNGLPPLDPDTLANYELGARGDLFDNRLRYDVALYYLDWQDIQQTLTVPSPLPPNGPVSALVNGESASGLGVDLGLAATLMEGLTIGLNVGWNDLTLDKPVLTGVPPIAIANAGERIQLSPEYTVAVSAEYAFPLGGDFAGRLGATANYTSEQVDRQYLGAFGSFYGASDEILVGRASFSINAPTNWSATLFVNNIGNEDAATMRGGFSLLPSFGGDVNSRPRPRTIGIQLDYRY
jgi:outer membrane receptor protein involved in Fe transport